MDHVVKITVTDCPEFVAALLCEFARQGIVAEVGVEAFGVNRTTTVILLTGGH